VQLCLFPAIVFQAINSVLEELGPYKIKSHFEPWTALGKAPNPLYRLLALRAATFTTSQEAWNTSPEDKEFNAMDGSAKLGFYLEYLDEEDPVILSQVVRALTFVPKPEARQAIEKLETTGEQKGDASLVQTAKEALRTMDLMSKGSR